MTDTIKGIPNACDSTSATAEAPVLDPTVENIVADLSRLRAEMDDVRSQVAELRLLVLGAAPQQPAG